MIISYHPARNELIYAYSSGRQYTISYSNINLHHHSNLIVKIELISGRTQYSNSIEEIKITLHFMIGYTAYDYTVLINKLRTINIYQDNLYCAICTKCTI